MRRMSVLLFGLALVACAQGCGKTLRCTSGICDCYPPPVDSLLQAPCPKPGHPSSPLAGAYAPAPYARHHVTPLAAPAPQAEPKPAEKLTVPPKVEEKEKDS